MSPRDLLVHAIRARVDPRAAAWLEEAASRVRTGPQDMLLEAYTLASAKLGSVPLDLQTADLEAGALPGPAGAAADTPAARPGVWTAADAGRLTLLLARADAAL